MPQHHPQVGAPDPERQTSPILDDEELEDIEPEGSGLCDCNGVAYRAGDHVTSGHEVLRCEPPGLWVRQGETDEAGRREIS